MFLCDAINEKILFWVKEKKQSNAEIDFVIKYENMLIPIEVKSGSSGRLRSLYEFIDNAPHKYAIRVYSGNFRIDKPKTIKGNDFILMNLPFYLLGCINKYLAWLVRYGH